jgi:hypothetical protein
MNINLDNYETFFLMYVDNELSAADREMVEVFTAQYPYLKQELQLLQDTVLLIEADDMGIDKTSLYKPAASEEKMLLLLDNELTGEAKEQLLWVIQQDNMLKKDWALLQQTKLDPDDQYIFENKAILCRKERLPIISLAYLRWAAAAVLIAAGFFVAIRFTNTPRSIELVMHPVNSDTNGSANSTKLLINNTSSTSTISNSQAADSASKWKKTTNNQQVGHFVNLAKSTTVSKMTVVKGLQPTDASNGSIKYLAKDDPTNTTNDNLAKPFPEKNEALLANQTIDKADPVKVPDIQTSISFNVDKENLRNGVAPMRVASLNSEANNDRIFILDEEDVSRSKAGALYKRLKRTVARTAGVKPGNSLKIAGFEFAVK